MHLEEAIERLQEILSEMEGNQLPLHEIMKLHQEGNKLVAHSEKLLKQAQKKLKVTEVGVDSAGDNLDGESPENESDTPNESDIELF